MVVVVEKKTMHIVKVIKDFGEAKDKKSGLPLFGMRPNKSTFIRLNQEDYDIVKPHGLIEDVKKKPARRSRKRSVTISEQNAD